jgi:hypothetical protein
MVRSSPSESKPQTSFILSATMSPKILRDVSLGGRISLGVSGGRAKKLERCDERTERQSREGVKKEGGSVPCRATRQNREGRKRNLGKGHGRNYKPHVREALRKYNLVSFQKRSISTLQPMLFHLHDFLPLLDFDLPIRGQLTTPNINVGAPTPLEVLHNKPAFIWPCI